MRKIIFHYHFFKNAGTSVDALLKSSFPGRWVTREFETTNSTDHLRQVAAWIQENPDAIAFSSHTAMLATLPIEGIDLFPVVFLRHPIDRLESVYLFERKQGLEGHTGFGPILAKHTSFAGYVDVRLAFPHDRQCRDFHVGKLATRYLGEAADEVTRAQRALTALPFVGVVEHFETSIRLLVEHLQVDYPTMRLWFPQENVINELSTPNETRKNRIKTALGDDIFARVTAANRADLDLHQSAVELVKSRADTLFSISTIGSK